MRSAAEVDALKRNWHGSPCWDIEETEGFGEHWEDLYRYRVDCENLWAKQRRNQLAEKAVELGCPENLKLAAYVESMESRLEALEDA